MMSHKKKPELLYNNYELHNNYEELTEKKKTGRKRRIRYINKIDGINLPGSRE